MRMWVWSLASLSGLGIWHCHELWCRSQIGLDATLLWLWLWMAAAAPLRPLAWELPHTTGVALKKRGRGRRRETWGCHQQSAAQWQRGGKYGKKSQQLGRTHSNVLCRSNRSSRKEEIKRNGRDEIFEGVKAKTIPKLIGKKKHRTILQIQEVPGRG